MEKIDKLDRQILEIISQNARIPFKDVAAECGVSRAAIHQRVQRLIDMGVIIGSGYHVNPKSLGYRTCTYVGIKLEKGSMYKSVVDELEKIPESSNLTLRRIVLQPLDFTPYCRVTTTPTHIYTTRNPIPKHQKPEVARVYKILLGTFQKAQQPNIFRKVSPLSYERTEGGKYRYYAGLYKNYDEVLEDIERLKEIGFRRPEPVVWEDGVYRNLAEESENSYRVEFTCPNGVISNTIKALIDVFAKGKETSRINTETGVVYIIGTFDTENKAQELVDALNRMDGVKAKLTQNE